MHSYSYTYDLNHGRDGRATIQATDTRQALALVCEGALADDWGDDAVTVVVRVWREDEHGDEVESDETELLIPSAADRRLADGEVLHEDEHEFRTDRLVRVEDEFFLVHANGGSRGATQVGANSFPECLQPTEPMDRTEARAWLLGHGLDPADVATMTRVP